MNSTQYTDDELFARLKRAGELEVEDGIDPQETASYFDVERFVFDGPGGARLNYDGLVAYFVSIRAAFDDLRIRRGEPIISGYRIGVQTWITGVFAHEFTMSPIGPLEPNGGDVVLNLNNLYTFDESGRIVEEIVRMDNLEFLAQMGVTPPTAAR